MVIAIDFDGTIVEHRFPDIGPPVPGAIKWIKEFQKAGAKIVLYTMRSDGQSSGNVLTDAVDYLKKNGVDLHGVNVNPDQAKWTSSPKCYAKLYIDDAAFGCPLKESIRYDRPYVDWDAVGPKVLEEIKIRMSGLD